MIVHPVRRRAAGLLAATVVLSIGGAVAGVAPASAAATDLPVGLFGSQDPTYDGVFRQSLALLAYEAAGQTPPAESVDWLLGQQCPDGGFEAYRADPAAACRPGDASSYSGEDTNSTALAAAALRALGRTAPAAQATAWLRATQRPDGGFPYYPGGDSDANSTASVLLATNAAGTAPDDVTSGGPSAADFLAGLQIGCAGAAAGDDGGFAYQDYGTGLFANDAATVQVVFALTGRPLPTTASAGSSALPRYDCPTPTAVPSGASVVDAGAGFVGRVLQQYDGAIPQVDYSTGARKPGTVSVGDTAWAALGLAATGVGSAQLAAALDVLAAETAPTKAAAARSAAVASASTDQPGLLALVALAGAAGGASADSVDALVDRIGATVTTASTATPTPSASPSRTATPSASPTPSPTGPSASTSDAPAVVTDGLADSGATPLTPWLALLGVGLVAAGAGSLALSRSRGDHA